MEKWNEFVSLMSKNKEYVEKTLILTQQVVYLCIFLILMNNYIGLTRKQFAILVVLEIIILIVYHLDSTSFNKIKEQTLLRIYEKQIRDQNISENDVSKLAFKYTYYDLPVSIFIDYMKKNYIIVISIYLLLHVLTKTPPVST